MSKRHSGFWGRLGDRLESTRVPGWAADRRVMNRLSYLPVVPGVGRSRRIRWEPAQDLADRVPAALRTTPGILRDPEAEARSFREQGPIPLFSDTHTVELAFVRRHIWRSLVVMAPRVMRAYRRLGGQVVEPARPASGTPDAAATTRRVRELAEEIGLSTIGVARFDPKYTFAPYQDDVVGDRVIVCLLEQDWEATQGIPSLRAELVVQRTYGEISEMAGRLAAGLREMGYRARADVPFGTAASIHYGVEAGLGQLGMNGQLLTPQAGSRCRITLVRTDAPLEFDRPVDYGIPAICEQCRACVRRCPVGAIPSKREFHRGVWKAKIKTDRCLPTVAQADGCGVCMKVCPVQRYGLEPVLDHWDRTGEIMGVGTDELEAYVWPLDGLRYGPGERPRDALLPSFLNPPMLKGAGADLGGVGDAEQLPEP